MGSNQSHNPLHRNRVDHTNNNIHYEALHRLTGGRAGSRRRNGLAESSLRFSSIHGENVHISQGGTVATRTNSFCKAIAFTNRSVKVNEKICLKFIDVSTNWSGVIRFGFSSHSPNSLRSVLPKFVCPDLTSKPGFWAKAFNDAFVKQDSILFYFVTPSGDVYFGINGDVKGVFFTGVDTSKELWGLLDIYGNTTAVELMDFETCDRLNDLSRVIASLIISPSRGNPVNIVHYPDVARHAIQFHKTKGKYIAGDGCTAWRLGDPVNVYKNGYLFTSRPVTVGETLVIQIQKNHCVIPSRLTFGLTSCDPQTLSAYALPDDSRSLLDRPEYWVLIEDAVTLANEGDEFGFTIASSGIVKASRNGSAPSVIMHVDNSIPLWGFFDVCGMHKLFIAGTISVADHPISDDHVRSIQPGADLYRFALTSAPSPTSFTQRASASLVARNNFPLVCGALANGGSAETSRPGDAENQANRNTPHFSTPSQEISSWSLECMICCEKDVDSCFYSCGHMCMCYECATNYWRAQESGCCPICRAPIADVIRTYKS